MKTPELITLKFTENLSVLPFLVLALTFGLTMPFLGMKQAVAFALIPFAMAGGCEYIYRQTNAKFHQHLAAFKKMLGYDSYLFLEGAGKVYTANRDLKANLKTADIAVYGLIYRYVTAPPFKLIEGPLCPDCKETLVYDRFSFILQSIGRFRYECLCGFKKTINKNPYDIYKEVRTHFCLPLR